MSEGEQRGGLRGFFLRGRKKDTVAGKEASEYRELPFSEEARHSLRVNRIHKLDQITTHLAPGLRRRNTSSGAPSLLMTGIRLNEGRMSPQGSNINTSEARLGQLVDILYLEGRDISSLGQNPAQSMWEPFVVIDSTVPEEVVAKLTEQNERRPQGMIGPLPRFLGYFDATNPDGWQVGVIDTQEKTVLKYSGSNNQH